MSFIAGKIFALHASCKIHSNVNVKYFCETCSRLICAACVATDHNGHVIKHETGEIYHSKDEILKFVNYQEYTRLPRLKRRIKLVDRTIKDNERKFRSTAVDITKQGERLKYEISVMTRSLVSVCETIMIENDKLLEKFKTEIEEQIKTANEAIDQCKEFLVDGKKIVNLESVKNEADTNGASLKLVKFEGCGFTDVYLKKAFGDLHIKGYGHTETDSDRQSDISSTEEGQAQRERAIDDFDWTKVPDEAEEHTYEQLRVVDRGVAGLKLVDVNHEKHHKFNHKTLPVENKVVRKLVDVNHEKHRKFKYKTLPLENKIVQKNSSAEDKDRDNGFYGTVV